MYYNQYWYQKYSNLSSRTDGGNFPRFTSSQIRRLSLRFWLWLPFGPKEFELNVVVVIESIRSSCFWVNYNSLWVRPNVYEQNSRQHWYNLIYTFLLLNSCVVPFHSHWKASNTDGPQFGFHFRTCFVFTGMEGRGQGMVGRHRSSAEQSAKT